MLERLRQLLPAPADPVEPGQPDNWAEIEQALGTGLPSDFKTFTELYGSGKVDDFLYMFNPFAAGQDGNLLAEKDRVLKGYRQTRARFPERLPLPPFPDPGGVLPLAGPTTVTSCTGSPKATRTAGRWRCWSRGPPARRSTHAGNRVPGRAGRQPAHLPDPARRPDRPVQPPVHPARLSRRRAGRPQAASGPGGGRRPWLSMPRWRISSACSRCYLRAMSEVGRGGVTPTTAAPS